ncbi:MAG: ABC transporter permease [Lachnospiraceae bacterium]|nr:ABC transporter permease [Lachnospiraceae bacterium]
MNLFSFILYDIKRLFGHGKTAFIAMFSPIPVLLMFALFMAPLLLDAGEAFYSVAVFNEDDNEKVSRLMNIIINYEVDKGNVSVYPVKEKETGRKLVDEGKVAIFMYIPPNTYKDSMSGKVAEMEFYYSPSHAFDAMVLYTGIKSSLSVFGQSIGVVNEAIEIARKLGLSEEEILVIWNDGISDLLTVFISRGRVIGKNGIFNFGADYHFRLVIAILFATCSYLSSFPVIYLTSLDLSETFSKRNIPPKRLFGYYIARIISGSVLIVLSFLIMYPVARLLRSIKIHFALSVIPGIILTSLVFSALAVLIGSLFKRGQSALWAGLYFGTASIAAVSFLSDKANLPGVVSFMMRISPFRASVSIFSNAMVNFVTERYGFELCILAAAFAIFFAAGFLIYRKRSAV